MRLPQSTIRPSFFETIHLLTIGLAVAVLCMWPVTAGAATTQLVCTRTQIEFGGVVVGQTETMLVTLTNTGQKSVTISGIGLSNSEFAVPGLNPPLTLPAGQSVDVNISFTPSGLRWTGGTIKFSSNASNAILGLDVGGTGVNSEPVTASPSTVSFGQVAIGASSTQSFVLTNARPWRATLLAPQVQGSEFSIGGGAFPVTLGGGQSVTVNVTFAPKSAGTTGGSLFIPDVALVIPLVGTGTGAATTPGQVDITPSALSFGSVPDGTTQTLPVTVTASGGSVTVSSAISSSSQFVLSGASFPMTLAAGQSVSFKVAFTPQASGAVSGSLSLASNASNSGTAESLTGIGTAPAPGQLAIAPAPLSFGSVPVGTTQTLPVTVSASGASVTVSSAISSSSQFVLSGASFPMTLAAGQSASFKVAFTPQASGTVSGSLSLASNASNSGTPEALTGTGTAPAPGQLAIAPAPLNFGSVTVGTTQTLPVTVSASGGSVTVSSIVSSSSQFALSGASFPMTLAAGQSASFNVAFTPQASGAVSGSLSLASNASNSGTPESLTGTGTAPAPGQLAIAPAPLNFGSVPVGTTQTLPVTLSASGASVTVSSAGSSSSQFALSGASFPMTIAAGQSVSFNVAFTPQASGTVSGSLSLASNASNSGTPEPLTGVGTVTSYSVNLSWNASSDVMGYNVYRSTASNGTYSKINSSVSANTAYSDSTVVSGHTYYYAATSVNSSGQESGMSTPVTAAVP